MGRHPTSCRIDAAQGTALATLGMVALLIALLTERLLPRCAGCALARGPVLRMHAAMATLAVLAWREIETPSRGSEGLDAMMPAATAMLDALRDLLAVLARRPGRPFPSCGRGEASSAALPETGAPARRALAVRARDGPGPPLR